MRARTLGPIVVALMLTAGMAGSAIADKGSNKKSSTSRTITLPGTNVFPEGVTAAGKRIYVGSSQDGTIFTARRGDKEATVLSPAGSDGRNSAIGMKVDRNGHLVVAGGASGIVWVLDRKTGATLGKFSNAGMYAPGGPTFLNDIAITKNGDAYVTDSFAAVIYRIPAAALRTPPANGSLEPWLLLDGTPITYQPGFNLNGIVAKKNSTLLVVQANTGKLFRVAIGTKTVTEVAVTGTTLTGGDGMLLFDGRKLAVVHQGKVDVLKLSKSWTSARLRKTITNATFDSPTTAALLKGRLYVVNSQFAKRAAPTLPFTVSVVNPGHGSK